MAELQGIMFTDAYRSNQSCSKLNGKDRVSPVFHQKMKIQPFQVDCMQWDYWTVQKISCYMLLHNISNINKMVEQILFNKRWKMEDNPLIIQKYKVMF